MGIEKTEWRQRVPKGRGLASIGESGWRFLLATYGDVHQCQATETRRCDFFWLRARTAAEEGTGPLRRHRCSPASFACRYFLHRLTLLFPARRTPAGTELTQKNVVLGVYEKREFFRTVFSTPSSINEAFGQIHVLFFFHGHRWAKQQSFPSCVPNFFSWELWGARTSFF